VRPWLLREPAAPLWSPREAGRWRRPAKRAERRPDQAPTPRQTSRTVGEHYTVASYRRAVRRACEAAGIPPWSPHQLRHTAATQVRARYGLEGAQVVLGHASADVTQIYAERDQALARSIARDMG